jgi:hypothetical protein
LLIPTSAVLGGRSGFDVAAGAVASLADGLIPNAIHCLTTEKWRNRSCSAIRGPDRQGLP